MSLIKSLTLTGALCLISFGFLFPTRAAAQSNKPAEAVQEDRDQILKRLLAEVRELRLVIQRAFISKPR